MSWWQLLGLAAVAYGFKALGVMALGRVRPTGRAVRAIEVLPAALLAALVVVETVGDGRALVVDARVVGLGFAAVAVWRRWPFLVVVVGASAATALVRLLA